MLWWKSILALVKVAVVSIYSTTDSNTDYHNDSSSRSNSNTNNITAAIMESTESSSCIAGETSSRTVVVDTPSTQQKSVLVDTTTTTSTTENVVTKTTTSSKPIIDTVTNNDTTVRPDSSSSSSSSKDYYVHPHAGYVKSRNSSSSSSTTGTTTTMNQNYYKCQWQNYHGYIIAGSKAIVFQGSFFLFDKTFILKWDNIRQVVLIDPSTSSNTSNSGGYNSGRNNNNLNSNSGIEIIMSDETVHSFIMNPQQQGCTTTTTKVWLSLLSLHNDALLGRTGQNREKSLTAVTTKMTNPSLSSQKQRNYERRNSDPAKTSILMSPDFIFEEDDDDAPIVPTTTIMSTMTEQIPIDTIMVHAGTPLRLQPIHCTYKSTDGDSTESDGRLYTGNDTVLFIGTSHQLRNYFATTTWEHLIVTIPWTSILRIEQRKTLEQSGKNSATTPPNQIGIRIRTKCDMIIGETIAEEKTFDFERIETPEHVWASLVAIHNEKLLQVASKIGTTSITPKHPNKKSSGMSTNILSGSKTTHGPTNHRESITISSSSSNNRRKSHRRTNSDPMMASIQINFDNYQQAIPENQYENNEANSAVVPSSDIEVTSTNMATVVNETGQQPMTIVAGTSYTDMWLSMKNQNMKDVYSNVVIENLMIENCTLDQFYNTFVNDHAMYSIDHFLTGLGDFDVRTSDWEEDIKDGVQVPTVAPSASTTGWKQYKRVIKYMHPVNVPLAPPQAAARKEQVLTHYDSAGICIVTQTFVDDVPMTDCFYVADRMLIEPSSTTRGGLTVRMEFGITFVKSTMFKGIISRKTTAEFIELFNALAGYISAAIIDVNSPPIVEDIDNSVKLADGDDVTLNTPKVQQLQVNDVTIKSTFQTFFSADRIILLLIAIVQLWILMELKGMKQAIITLEQQQRQTS